MKPEPQPRRESEPTEYQYCSATFSGRGCHLPAHHASKPDWDGTHRFTRDLRVQAERQEERIFCDNEEHPDETVVKERAAKFLSERSESPATHEYVEPEFISNHRDALHCAHLGCGGQPRSAPCHQTDILSGGYKREEEAVIDDTDLLLEPLSEAASDPPERIWLNQATDDGYIQREWMGKPVVIPGKQQAIEYVRVHPAAQPGEIWKAARRLILHRIGVMTNAGLSREMYERLRDDINENFDIASRSKGLDWLHGKCTYEDFLAANPDFGVDAPAAQGDIVDRKFKEASNSVEQFLDSELLSNWPLPDVLTKLADWCEHLMRDHDCDSHGYEELSFAIPAARLYAAAQVVDRDAEFQRGLEAAAMVGFQVVTDHADGNKFQVSVLAHKVAAAIRTLNPSSAATPTADRDAIIRECAAIAEAAAKAFIARSLDAEPTLIHERNDYWQRGKGAQFVMEQITALSTTPPAEKENE